MLYTHIFTQSDAPLWGGNAAQSGHKPAATTTSPPFLGGRTSRKEKVMKINVKITYSEWEEGSGWRVQGAYCGIDEEEYEVAENTDFEKYITETLDELESEGLLEDENCLYTVEIQTPIYYDGEIDDWETVAEGDRWGNPNED